jgi:phenylpyruvate tautomerase PptA (4-oxalocrotonate tautomerase family)
MPIIKISIPENTIDQNKKTKMVKYLSQALLKIEGLPNTKDSRSLAWCFFEEMKKGTWLVGGEVKTDLMFYIQVYLFKETLNKKKKKEIAENINTILKETCKKDFKKNKALILINEVPDYNFCYGGKNIGINELAKYLNIKLESLKN